MTAPGRLVAGRYRLRGQIGGGGMGAVWLARDERLDRDVAIKQVLPPVDADPSAARQQRERALREGRIAARLSHPHAISVYDVALEDDQPWLVMEYLPSRSLAAVLAEDGVLRVDQAAQIGAQIADALVATHAAGIVHRDVKPANVLIGRGRGIQGLVKITDFGISHASGDVNLTQTGQITGTPAYLAPEVARGIEPGPAADVFSLGATLYTCLEGQPPFGTGDNALQQLHRVAAGTIQPPRHSGALTGPLLRMLAADPASRPNMKDVRNELAGIAAGREGDTTTVLAAPTDITSPGGTIPGRTSAFAGAAPGASSEDHEEPAPTAPEAPPTVRPPSPAPTGDASGRRRPRIPPLGWVAAAVLAVLAGLVVWALAQNGDPGTGTASPRTTSPTSTATPRTTTTGTGTASPRTTSPTSTATPRTTVPHEPATGGDGSNAAVSANATTTTGTAPAGGVDGVATIKATSVKQYLDEYHKAVVDDPAAAYEQAGPTLRSSISLAGFEKFWAPFSDVSISELQTEGGGNTALALMELRYPDGTRQVERHQFRFVDKDGHLALDRDRFVKMIKSRS
ncbi:MAG: serine/threonine-protein kinase [Mycobacteriales bacterium]